MNTTTFDDVMLPVTFNTEVPEELNSNELVISGVTIKGVQVQCLFGDKYEKMVTTNGSGKFNFKVPVKTEGEYKLTIVFQKKGYDTRRFTYTVNRRVSKEEQNRDAVKNAVKPAYQTLTAKLAGYTGKTMRYKVWIVEINQAENGV